MELRVRVQIAPGTIDESSIDSWDAMLPVLNSTLTQLAAIVSHLALLVARGRLSGPVGPEDLAVQVCSWMLAAVVPETVKMSKPVLVCAQVESREVKPAGRALGLCLAGS